MMKGVHLVCQLKKREKVFKRQRPRRSESGMTETQRWPLQQQLQQSKLSEVVGVSLSLVDGGPHLAAGGGCPHLQRLAGPGSLPSSDRKGDVGIAGRTSVQDRLEATAETLQNASFDSLSPTEWPHRGQVARRKYNCAGAKGPSEEAGFPGGGGCR